MKIKEGMVKVKETSEIHIYIEKNGKREKAKILECKQDSLNRTYITVW